MIHARIRRSIFADSYPSIRVILAPMRVRNLRYGWVLLSVFLFAACQTTPETGRKVLILTSEKEEMALGIQAFAEVLRKESVSGNRRWTQILERIGKRIADAARQPDYQWEFKLLESKEKNAFCLPGGKVAFYTGIYSVAQNEAALAAVMGHEVAHATARHAGQRITLSLGTELGLAALGSIIGGGDSVEKKALMAALGLGTTLGAALPFSRANESEADEIGLIYMARAGYDPKEAPRFWERFSKYGSSMPTFLSTHPQSEDRMRALDRKLPSVLAEYQGSKQYGLGETL